MAKLSNVVKNDVVNKTEYNKLVTKVDNVDTTEFVLKTTYNTDKSDLEKWLSEKKTDFNSNITEIEGKMPSISGICTNSALTAIENKIPNVSNLVKKKTITQKSVKLNIRLVIIIMTNTLLLQNLIF